MSASRHTYVVTFDAHVPAVGPGAQPATILVFNGDSPAVFGSKKKAEKYRAEMASAFPDVQYVVRQLR